jgi:hypothetical protein
MVRALCLWLALLLTCWLSPTTASAQDAKTQIKQLYEQGLEQYDFFEYEAARKLFEQGIEVAKTAKVQDPYVAKLYIAVALLDYAQFKDSAPQVAESKARDGFMVALTIDKTVKIDENYSTPELEGIFVQVQKSIGGGGTGPGPGPGPSPSAAPTIVHQALTVVNAGDPLSFRANVPNHPDVFRVRVRYRGPTAGDFESLELQPSPQSPDVFVASLPTMGLTYSNLFYYIEVLDRTQTIKASAGTPAAPFKVTILGKSDKVEDPVSSKKMPLMTTAIGVGMGVGLASGDSLNCAKTSKCHGGQPERLKGVAPGMARTSSMLTLDGMFFIIPEIELGLYTRIQFEPETETFMIGAKLRYFLYQDGDHRVYAGLVAGYGHVRYLVNLGASFNNFTDVVEKGPVHIGPNFGYMLAFNKNVGMHFDMLIPIHFPDFTFHIDIAVGPYFQF